MENCLDLGWLQINETVESETMHKGGTTVPMICNLLENHSPPMFSLHQAFDLLTRGRHFICSQKQENTK